MSRPRTAARSPAPPAGKVRIIAGRWRGSRLEVPAVPGLRPSPDRVRETLFNWLQGDVAGARCLDLFAGSGALGFEAASRGAGEVVMVERDPRALAALGAAKARLGADQVEVVADDALAWLMRGPGRPFDVVFVDPPFAAGLHRAVLAALGPWLSPAAKVYVESARGEPVHELSGFTPHRQGETRDTRHVLFVRGKDASVHDAPATLAPSSGDQAPPTT